MIWRLLRRNISIWQIVGYAMASFVGMSIVLVAVQFYFDLRSVLGGTDSGSIDFLPEHNIVISKRVGVRSALTGVAPTFNENEIEDLQSQQWCGRVSRFQASDFGVYGGVEFGGQSMSTAMFFESVPDDLVDVEAEDWFFDPKQPMIPIIVSKDYLTLYNFGFASTGRAPVVNESLISSLPLKVVLSGNGKRDVYPARIVGFSSWLNTIAVPQSFMEWAHVIYGSGVVANPSRLVVEIVDFGNPEVESYMEDCGYEIAGPQNALGQSAQFLKLLTTVVVSIGGVISILALFILILSLSLLMTKNRKAIHGLFMLGYTSWNIAKNYIVMTSLIVISVGVTSVIVAAVVRNFWLPVLEATSVVSVGIMPSIGVAIAIMAVIIFINVAVILRFVRKSFR